MRIKKGFTLLEILVVIGIIMVLVGIMTVSYGTAQRKSRDARRKSDLSAISNALEQYFSICNYVYPTPVSGALKSPVVCGTTTLMPKVPGDPKTGASYTMSQTVVGADYTIGASLETETPSLYTVTSQQ